MWKNMITKQFCKCFFEKTILSVVCECLTGIHETKETLLDSPTSCVCGASTLAQPQNLRKPKSIPLNLFIPSTLSFSFCIWLPLVQDLHFSLTLGKDTHKDRTKSQCDIFFCPTCFSNIKNSLQNFHVLPCKFPKISRPLYTKILTCRYVYIWLI